MPMLLNLNAQTYIKTNKGKDEAQKTFVLIMEQIAVTLLHRCRQKFLGLVNMF